MGILSSKLSARTMAPLCRELATTYGAGIPLLKTLRLASEHKGPLKVRGMLQRMEMAIQNGSTLTQAAKAEQTLLPEMFIEVIAAGEMGGRLDILLNDLADYYENTWKMQRSAMSAMVYPLLQLISAWFLGTFALGLIRNLDPSATGRFDLNAYVASYATFQAAALLVGGACAVVLIGMARLGMLRMPWTLFKTVVFPVRLIANKFAMARFFRTLALLIGAGLNIRQCVERSAAVTLNPLMERDLLRSLPTIMRGGTLTEAFAGSRYINRVGQEMIAVGEQSGQLDATLRKVADYYYDEAQAAVNAATRLLFVATVLAVGVIVGAIVIYFYAGLYGSLLSDI